MTNKYLLKTIVLIVCLSGIANLSKAQPLNSQAIDALVQRSMKTFNVPGIAVGIIKDGQVIYAKGHGVRSLNTNQPMDENTLFGIASNSKAFTAAALGILVDEGKLKWDDKVRDYIPEFKLYNAYVSEDFTIRDLLTHRSGLGMGAGDLMLVDDGSDFTIKDVIHNLRYLKQTSSFRTKYDYDNNLYIVAGEVITRITGKSWPEFVEERIIQPLGMNKTAGLTDRLKDKSNVIDAHAAVEGKVQVIARMKFTVGAAAGGINSNITDLLKWVQTLLAHGKYGEGQSKRLYSEAVAQELWTPQTILRVRTPGPYNTHFSAYGLGFFLSDVNGYKEVSHTGGLPGEFTQITLLPELNLAIILLTNQQEAEAMFSITNQIKDAYFGKTGTDWIADAAKRRAQAIAEAKAITDAVWNNINKALQNGQTQDINLFVGNYADAWLGNAMITLKNGKLRFDAKRSPHMTGEMLPYKGTTFVVKWDDRSMDADAYLTFTLDQEGKASGFTMKAISPLTDFSYDFHDLDFHRVK